MFCDCLSVCRLAAEVDAAVVGGRVTQVCQSDDRSLLIRFRCAGEAVSLLLSADARLARMHLGDQPFEAATPPPGFCRLLRKRLEGARLVQVVQVGGDRVVELTFEGRDELGDRLTSFLVGEFMGRHSNLVLLDDTRRIVDAVKRVPGRVNRVRVVLPGKPYVFPPAPPVNLVTATRAELSDVLTRRDAARESATVAEALRRVAPGLGRLLIAEVCFRAGVDAQAAAVGESAWDRVAAVVVELVQTVSGEPPLPVLVPAPDRPPVFAPLPLRAHDQGVPWQGGTLSSLVAHCAQIESEDRKRRGKTGAVTQRARKLARRLERQRACLLAELSRAREAELDRRKGQALLVRLADIPAGAARVELDCPETGERLTVDLDPMLSPAANAERYFARRRKRLRAQEQVPKRLRETENRLARLRELLQAAHESAGGSVARELDRFVAQEEPAVVTVRGTRPGEETTFLRIRLKSGLEAFLGRSARENDLLRSRVARPDDLWFHVRGLPGPHGLLRLASRSQPAPQEAIREMARLMARRGKAGRQATVAVDYCPAKYVRKVKGGPPGAVTYTHHRTVFVKTAPPCGR